MLVPVWAGSAKLLSDDARTWETIRRSYALPFIVVGVATISWARHRAPLRRFAVCRRSGISLTLPIGHSHATMYGFITFIAWGGIYALLPRATGKRRTLLATGLHFWLATIGVTLYVLALSVAGTLQGLDWAAGNPFIASVDAAAPYWVARAVAGSMMFLAHVFFAYNVYRMTIAPGADTSSVTVGEGASV